MSEEEKVPWRTAAERAAEAAAGASASGTVITGASISAGPMTISSGPPGGIVSGTFKPSPGTRATSANPPARKPLEHVLMPQRTPRRVLVAFLDEEGNHEPFWAAYLAPVGIEVSMCPDEPEDAHMDLRLSLVKRFEQ